VFNANLGVSYRPEERVALHANLTAKSRFPTLKEFYSETQGRNVSNPGLVPEQSVNTEAGVSFGYYRENIFMLNFFYSGVKSMIQEVSLPGGLRQYQNIGKVVLAGLEFSADYQHENFKIDLNYTYLYAKNRTDNSATDKLEYRPEHSASIIAQYLFEFGLNLGAEIFYIGKEYGINLDNGAIVPMSDYRLFNFRAAQKISGSCQVYTRINNVFDERYESEYGYPQPGREFLFGLKCNW
jgi:outer membrane cobalamin receptor